MHALRFRQIHLDFHTSEQIPGIGSEFNADEFVQTLKRAHVNSITLFSRCHHGMIYHDTKFPAKHPHLTCNLLAEQIQACHAADIRCPIYISVGLDEYMAREHPEWLEVDENGRMAGPGPLGAGFKKLCFASPYMDYVVEQTEEVLDMFGDEVDGLFFDIISQHGVFGKWCKELFVQEGMDPTDPRAQAAMRRLLVDRYKERMTAAVRAKNTECLVFHNSGHVSPDFRSVLHTYSHLELESLPSGGWGYAHFPITMRYARGLGLDCMGMTGKFAKTWGHFNSYKPQAALEYECFNMLAHGAKCSVGDQLHPRGRLDAATYELIGSVYEQVEAREPWCEGAVPVTDIGVFNVEALGKEDGRVDSSALGAYRMLLEGRHQFDFIDGESDWLRYPVVILPDKVTLGEDLRAKVEHYVASGRSLLLSHQSGMDPECSKFVLRDMPVRCVGTLPFHPDFVKPQGWLSDGLPAAEFVMYEPGLQVRAVPGAEVLGRVYEPYFDRNYEHFCSHFHTPVDGEGKDPGIVSKGRITYFAHPIFSTFAKHGMVAYKQLVLAVLRQMLPVPLVTAEAPTTLHVTCMAQPDKRRAIAHLLHYIPEKRTLAADSIEDVIPLYNVKLRVRTSRRGKVYLAPEGTELEFSIEDPYVEVMVPKVEGHTMVVFED